MADLTYLSARVNNFYLAVAPTISSINSAASTLSTDTNSVSNDYLVKALDGIAAGWKDSNSAGTKANCGLIIDAVQRLKTSVDSDLLPCIEKCQEVITKIDTMIAEYNKAVNNNWQDGCWIENVWTDFVNGIAQTFTGRKWIENDHAAIVSFNQKMEHDNSEVERMIDAIKNGMSGVSLGIVGNMTNNGSLGSYNMFQYNFTSQEFHESNWVTDVAWFTGGVVVGAAETVLKLGEGIVDAGATLVADVISLFGGDASGVVSWIRTDHVGDAVDKFTESVWWLDTDAAHSGRSIGNKAGDAAIYAGVVALGAAATAATGGSALAIIAPVVTAAKAVGNAGRTSETVLNATDGNLVAATVAGTAVGVIDYFTTRGAQKRFSAGNTTQNPNVDSGSNTALSIPQGNGGNTLALPSGGQATVNPQVLNIGPSQTLLSKARIVPTLDPIKNASMVQQAVKNKMITVSEAQELLRAFGQL